MSDNNDITKKINSKKFGNIELFIKKDSDLYEKYDSQKINNSEIILAHRLKKEGEDNQM